MARFALRGLTRVVSAPGTVPRLVDDPYTDCYPSAWRHCVVQHRQASVVLLCPGEFYADTVAASPVGQSTAL
jgi:hypothetical protein